MFQDYQGFTPPVDRLLALASTPFLAPEFRAACEAIAPFDPRYSDDHLWSFGFDPSGEPRLLVAVGERLALVDCAILSFSWWETSAREQHESEGSFLAERAEFDLRYARALEATSSQIGPPILQGSDPGSDYRHCVWQGQTGLLVLQQSNYDCQFGDDLNFWVQRWSGPIPRPTSPFLDWLTGRP